MTDIINCTPHDIVIFNGGQRVVLPASGIVARLKAKSSRIGDVNGIPLTQTEFGEIINLPEPAEGACYVVSALVAKAVIGKRNDVFVPNHAVRNKKGQIIGHRSLCRV